MSRRLSLLVAFLLLALPATARAATWTQVASGTSQDISAIEYQGADRFWFTTTNGGIFQRVNGTFVQRLAAPGVVFNDIEVRGSVGIAGANGGVIYRSSNGGVSWAPVSMPQSNPSGSTCTGTLPLGDVQKVAFATDQIVYAFGGQNQIMRSANAGASFANYNQNGSACRISANRAITGAFFVPGAPSVTGYLVSEYFGDTYFSSTDLQSGQAKQNGLNGYEVVHRLAGDPANPNRQWAISQQAGSRLAYTTNGWSSSDDVTIGNSKARQYDAPYDIGYNGGTVLVAGATGEILNSIDGKSFYYADAGGTLATQEWRAVGLASASAAAVGGTNGTLVVSSDANAVPPPPVATPTPQPSSSTAPRVIVPAPPVVISKPTVTLPSASNPPVALKRVKGGKVRMTVKGGFQMPPGVAYNLGCTGDIVLTVKKGKTLISARTATLARTTTSCRYRKTISLSSAKVGKATSLLVTVRFQGNGYLAAVSRTYAIKIQR